MKKKHSGLVSIGLILSAAAVAFVYYHYGFWKTAQAAAFQPLKPMPAISIPDENIVREIRQLDRKMDQLLRPATSENVSVDLLLFGYQSFELPDIDSKPTQKKLPVNMEYTLSFSFLSGQRRFCVIDGKFYGEGQTLPDGAKIVTIDSDRVLIQKKQFRKWIVAEKKPETSLPLK
jgi:hypothetical protein